MIIIRALAFLLLLLAGASSHAADSGEDVPLVVGHRTVHVFRASMGAFSAVERADGALHRIEKVFAENGDGWTSVKQTPEGFLIQIDGKPLFTVVPGDARDLAGETPEDLANQASRALQKAWNESREQQDPNAALRGFGKVAGALGVLFAVLFGIFRTTGYIKNALSKGLADRLKAASSQGFRARIAAVMPGFISHFVTLMAWLLGLLIVYVFFVFSLAQFVVTRPASESLSRSLFDLLRQSLSGIAGALPGMFVSVVIFLAAWIVTRISTEFFEHVGSGRGKVGLLNAHTAPATRRLANAAVWLFAMAMAYPYLPGSHTEAFRGLSVILGIMVSIGASGLVGQIASGIMLVYTHAIAVGEYVRIQDTEGTVTELGIFVTRLRNSMGQEIALPNALVLTSAIHNYSRVSHGRGFVYETAVTIGYDVPWRQVHALLMDAAKTIPELLASPPPTILQTALSDFYVSYTLVVHIDSLHMATRGKVITDLHGAIQDSFNRHGVQIMSPHYLQDPAKPKVVPEAAWFASPAAAPSAGGSVGPAKV
jgi:small-conductance mechanosensitive channel